MALEFYLREILDSPVERWLEAAGNATNYSGLLDQLGRFGAVTNSLLVTFNYDLLIESALGNVFGWQIVDIESYLIQGKALIRPHGSVNWKQYVSNMYGGEFTSHGQIIAAAARGEIRQGDIDLHWSMGRDRSARPVIAIPLDRGKKFVCPTTHLERLMADLERVTRVLIIGWRAAEQHFLDLLRERLRKNQPISLCIVDWHDSVRVVRDSLTDALSPAIRFDPLVLHDQGFSNFVRSCAVQDWLDKPLASY